MPHQFARGNQYNRLNCTYRMHSVLLPHKAREFVVINIRGNLYFIMEFGYVGHKIWSILILTVVVASRVASRGIDLGLKTVNHMGLLRIDFGRKVRSS